MTAGRHWKRPARKGRCTDMKDENELTMLKEHAPDAVVITPGALSEIITELMRPVMQTVGKMLENNTAALEQLASAQSIQNDRLEALEKQIRLQTKVDSKQVSYLNGAIKARSRELLHKREIDDPKYVTKLGNHIRKSILAMYGVSGLRDIPKHEYSVAMQQIEIWSNALTVWDIVKEYQEKTEKETEGGT